MEEQSEQFLDQHLFQIDKNDMLVANFTSFPNPLEPHPPTIEAVNERSCSPNLTKMLYKRKRAQNPELQPEVPSGH